MDANVWKPILEMLSLRDEESLTVATGVASNLLLSFSPSREVGYLLVIAIYIKSSVCVWGGGGGGGADKDLMVEHVKWIG